MLKYGTIQVLYDMGVYMQDNTKKASRRKTSKKSLNEKSNHCQANGNSSEIESNLTKQEESKQEQAYIKLLFKDLKIFIDKNTIQNIINILIFVFLCFLIFNSDFRHGFFEGVREATSTITHLLEF
jgi:Fe2+ transport system protein B